MRGKVQIAIFVFMKRLFLYISFVATLALGGCMGRTPRSVVKHFYGSIAEGEYDKALAVTTLADDADPEIYYAIMDKVGRSIEERGGIERIEVTAERVAEDEESAVVTTLITYANGDEQEEICDVVKVDEKWRVDVNLDSK